jgi:hypothetical protein
VSGVRPQRLTLSRQKGYSLKAQSLALNGLAAKKVTRPGPWGNPFEVAEIAKRYRLDAKGAQAKAVDLCTQWLIGALDPALSPGDPPPLGRIVAELKGYNLACWCAEGTPCHAEVLLEIANG